MFGKCVICFVFCAVTFNVKAEIEESDVTCSQNYGGTCVLEGECPKEKLAEVQGICPSGPGQRFECCYGLPSSATGCRGQGGECFSQPYTCSTMTRADDCASDQICCILIK